MFGLRNFAGGRAIRTKSMVPQSRSQAGHPVFSNGYCILAATLTFCSAHALVQSKCHSWSSQWGTTEANYVLVRSVVGWHGCMVSASVRERYEKMSYRPLRRNIPREPVPRLVLISQLAVVGIPEAAIGPVTCVGRLCKHALI